MLIMPNTYPAEQRERATRMALDRLDEYGSAWAVAQALGPKLGVGPETLRKWVLQAQTDAGQRSGPTSEELAEIKRLRKENAELCEANEVLKAASISSRGSSTLAAVDRRFIDEQRAAGRGVESICRALCSQGLQVAPRTYRA
jgi:transposase